MDAAHPWTLRLQRLRGTVDHDGIERITTQAIFDRLDGPQKARTPATCSTLARLMQDQGWSPVRVRGLTRGGFREQVRGYARDTLPNRRPRPNIASP